MLRVRAAEATDWGTLRDLRLEALGDAPDAFRGTHEDESRRGDDEWKAMATASARQPDARSFVLEIAGVAAGLTHAWIDRDREVLHIAAMWVRPSARGRGGGRALVSAALAWGAGRGAGTATLAVTVGNDAAARLYAAMGFVPTGATEPLRDDSELRVAWVTRSL